MILRLDETLQTMGIEDKKVGVKKMELSTLPSTGSTIFKNERGSDKISSAIPLAFPLDKSLPFWVSVFSSVKVIIENMFIVPSGYKAIILCEQDHKTI